MLLVSARSQDGAKKIISRTAVRRVVVEISGYEESVTHYFEAKNDPTFG